MAARAGGARDVAPYWGGSRDAPRSLDHCRIFDAGNDLHLPATGLAGFYLNLEHPLQALCPCHRRVAIDGWLLRTRRWAPTATRGCHLLA